MAQEREKGSKRREIGFRSMHKDCLDKNGLLLSERDGSLRDLVETMLLPGQLPAIAVGKGRQHGPKGVSLAGYRADIESSCEYRKSERGTME